MSIIDPREVARYKRENTLKQNNQGVMQSDSLGSILAESSLDKLVLSRFLELRKKRTGDIKFTAEGFEGPVVYDNKSGYAYATYEDTRTGRSANGRFAYDKDGTAYVIRLNDDQVYEIERALRVQAREQEGR
jgi:hypothetical protein